MSNTTNDSGPAFPQPVTRLDGDEGMTLRDYFAAKAMQAMCCTDYKDLIRKAGGADFSAEEIELCIAQAAYMQADAMLKARG